MSIPAAEAAAPAMARMPPSFSFEPFNPATATFDRWVQRLKVSFRIYHINEGDQRDYLLHYMGSATYDVLCNKLQATLPEDKTFQDIVDLLTAHYNPAPLEILENFKFNSRKQLDSEPLSDFVTDLERMARTCNFGAHLDNAIRNQFVFGIRNRTVQSRLLEVRDLTLAKAKELAFAMEMSFRGADEMHGSSTKPAVQHLEHGQTKKKKTVVPPPTTKAKPKPAAGGNPKACYRCGEADHFANKCNHKSTVCTYCKKTGHLDKVCQSKLKASKKTDTHFIDESCPVKEILHVHGVRGLVDKFLLDLVVNGRKLVFEVDTGSPVSLISAADKRYHFPEMRLAPTETQLVSYCGTDIHILGKLFVDIVSNGEKFKLPLHVADSERHPVLGRDWMLELNLDFNRIFKPGVHSISSPSAFGWHTVSADHANSDAMSRLPLTHTDSKYECQATRANPPNVSFHCWETPSEPFQRVHADYAGPFMGHYFLILIDAYSKWPDVRVVNSTTTESTIRECREFFSTYGIPSVFVSDNGPQFASADFAKFMKNNGIVHKFSAPYHPATNGQAERFIQTMKSKLKAMKCDRSEIRAELCSILLSYRKMVHPATGRSPSMMVFGRQIRSRLDLMVPSNDPKSNDTQRKIRELTVGTRVAVREYVHENKWEFGLIKERLGKLHYSISLDDGRQWRRHIDQIRKVGPDLPTTSSEEIFLRGDMPAGEDQAVETTSATATTSSPEGSSIPSSSSATTESTSAPSTVVAGANASSSRASTSSQHAPGSASRNQELRRSNRVIKPPARLNL